MGKELFKKKGGRFRKKMNLSQNTGIDITAHTFYTLEFLSTLKPNKFLPSHQAWEKDLKEFREEFNKKFYFALRDYITVISVGEGRCNLLYTGDIPLREKSYNLVNLISPKEFLEKLEKDFVEGDFTRDYGGRSWSRIAKFGKWLWENENNLPKNVMIDETINLSHNGGLMFNKPAIFYMYYSLNFFIDFLKDRASFLDFIPLLSRYPVPLKVRNLVQRARNLRLIENEPEFIYSPSYLEDSEVLDYTPIDFQKEFTNPEDFYVFLDEDYESEDEEYEDNEEYGDKNDENLKEMELVAELLKEDETK